MAKTIYNLDNPWLAYHYILNPPAPSDETMCSFLAHPIPRSVAQTIDLSQFGTIISEVPERLEIHLTEHELDRIGELKQAWVSKHAEAGMVCHVRLGHFEPDRSRTLVFQQGYKIPQGPQKADATAASTISVMLDQAPPFQFHGNELEWADMPAGEGAEEQAQVEEQVEEHTEKQAEIQAEKLADNPVENQVEQVEWQVEEPIENNGRSNSAENINIDVDLLTWSANETENQMRCAQQRNPSLEIW